MNFSLVDPMAETLQEVKAKNALDTLNHLKAEILRDMLSDTLAELEEKTFSIYREMWRP